MRAYTTMVMVLLVLSIDGCTPKQTPEEKAHNEISAYLNYVQRETKAPLNAIFASRTAPNKPEVRLNLLKKSVDKTTSIDHPYLCSGWATLNVTLETQDTKVRWEYEYKMLFTFKTDPNGKPGFLSLSTDFNEYIGYELVYCWSGDKIIDITDEQKKQMLKLLQPPMHDNMTSFIEETINAIKYPS